MSRKARERDRIRTELELTRNNGQTFLAIKSHHPKQDFMATPKKPSRRPTPVKRAAIDEETFDLHPQAQAPVASFVPQMEQTAIACVDRVLDTVDRGKNGDGFGATASGLEAAAYGIGFIASILNIAHTRTQSRRR